MSFYSQRSVKAVRKRHVCDGCLKHIEVGQPAERWAGMTDGDFGTCIYHPECRAAETAWNCDVLDCHSGDDWHPLHEIEREDWPWLIEEHPVAAARLNLAAALAKSEPA